MLLQMQINNYQFIIEMQNLLMELFKMQLLIHHIMLYLLYIKMIIN